MESFMEVIYKLISPSGKCYIGRTKSFNERMNEHKHMSKHSGGYTIHAAIRKYGWNNFTKEIIAKVKKEEASELERFFIDKYDTVRNGYNDTYNTERGGDVWKNRRDSKEYKNFIKKMLKLNSGKVNGMYGKKHKDISVQKMKEKAKSRFSLNWFIDKYGIDGGTEKYNKRCKDLSERKMKRDSRTGRFIKTLH